MVNSKALKIRVTKQQHERIKNEAQVKGYNTMSDYLRSIALGHDQSFMQQFHQMYEKIMQMEK